MCVPALKRTACVLKIRPRRNVLQGKMRPQVEEVQKEDRSGGGHIWLDQAVSTRLSSVVSKQYVNSIGKRKNGSLLK